MTRSGPPFPEAAEPAEFQAVDRDSCTRVTVSLPVHERPQEHQTQFQKLGEQLPLNPGRSALRNPPPAQCIDGFFEPRLGVEKIAFL